MKVELTKEQIDVMLLVLSHNRETMDKALDKSERLAPPDEFELAGHLANSLPYKDYLKTRHWKITRNKQVSDDLDKCRLCGANEYNTDDLELHVHHNTYDRKGYELSEDLLTLCADCHKMFHDNVKVCKNA